jgi:hypothetical protein
MIKLMTVRKTLILWILTSAMSYAIGMGIGFDAAGRDRPNSPGLILFGLGVSGLLNSVGYRSILDEKLKSLKHHVLSIKQVLPALGILTIILLLNIPILNLGNDYYNTYYSFWSIMGPVFVGGMTGIFQWLLVFKDVNGSGWWVLIFMLSLAVGKNLGFYTATFLFDVSLWGGNWFISGAVFGLIIGTATGATNSISILQMLTHVIPTMEQDGLHGTS